jgi:hypothetical protein
VRQGVRGDPVASDHRRRGDERVDDRFLGRLDDAVEQRIDDPIADGADLVVEWRFVVQAEGQAIAGRERDEQVPARMPAGPAGASDAQPGALREAPALVGEQWRVGRDDDDDRARSRRRGRSAQGLGGPVRAGELGPIAAPTGTPSTRSQSRLP